MNKKTNNLINQGLIITLLVTGLLLPIFVTAYSKASVSTKNATNINQTSATLRGEITNMGGYSEIEAWFDYGTTSSFGIATSIKKFEEEGNISQDLSDLSACTLYYFRAVAKNDSGISYGTKKTFKTDCPLLTIRISVKNLSRGDNVWYKSLKANPLERLLFRIEVNSNNDKEMKNVMAKVNLASDISYEGDLRIDNKTNSKNISTKVVNTGNLSPGQSKIITFKGKVKSKSNFSAGTNNLINTVLFYTTETSNTDSCKVIVKIESADQVDQVSTGITSGILDSILFPILIAFFVIWIFRVNLLL